MDGRIRALLERPELARARSFLLEDDARTLAQQRELTEIAAPPFGEAARGARFAELMKEAGLEDVEKDAEGNVLGWLRRGATDVQGAPLVVSAHLDTIFPPDTDVRVRQEGDRLIGPGISDDGRGLAALLGLARVLRATRPPLARPLLLVATVGEEGEGDLRGVRHLFRQRGPARGAHAFLSLDGAGLSRVVVTGGLGSRRFRVSASGPGGHSWVDWGTPNPIHALGHAIAAFTELPLREEPRTTLSVGRWSGGTSVNAIPQEAWVELELRSESLPELDRLDTEIRSGAEAAITAVNRSANGRGRVVLAVDVIGDRPARPDRCVRGDRACRARRHPRRRGGPRAGGLLDRREHPHVARDSGSDDGSGRRGRPRAHHRRVVPQRCGSRRGPARAAHGTGRGGLRLTRPSLRPECA